MLENKTKQLIFILIVWGVPLMSEPVFPAQNLIKSLNIEPAEDELVTIERLLQATQKQVAIQEQLKNLMIRLQREKDLFIKGDQSKLHARYMISTAAQIYRTIRVHGMQSLFASDFLEELALFTSIGKRDRVDVSNQIH